MNVSLRGGTEFWFPINKQFGPVNVSEVGVRYEEDTTELSQIHTVSRFSWMRMQRSLDSMLHVMILGVNIPILKPFDFGDWGFELKGLAIKMDKGKLKIAGALAKQEELCIFPRTSEQR
jgi:hypothetical protein